MVSALCFILVLVVAATGVAHASSGRLETCRGGRWLGLEVEGYSMARFGLLVLCGISQLRFLESKIIHSDKAVPNSKKVFISNC